MLPPLFEPSLGATKPSIDPGRPAQHAHAPQKSKHLPSGPLRSGIEIERAPGRSYFARGGRSKLTSPEEVRERGLSGKEHHHAPHDHSSRSDRHRNRYGQEHPSLDRPRRGAIVLREKVARGRIALRLANLPPCLIGIEAGMATTMLLASLPRLATM